jgi:RNA polymerase sigma factor (sigma-70 family)
MIRGDVATTLTEERAPPRTFEGFFADEYPRLVRALYLLSGGLAEAEDVAQEALARAYERWDRIRRMESPVGYLYRIAMNLHRRRLRRQALLGRWSSFERPEDPAPDAEERTDVMRALQGLPQELRAALVLQAWMGLTSEEAGHVQGIKPSSARARLHRARVAFRDQIGEGYA